MAITTMPASFGQSVHVSFPAGGAHKWWNLGIGNQTNDGAIVLDLYEPDGKQYAGVPWLRGKVSGKNCAAILWENTNLFDRFLSIF